MGVASWQTDWVAVLVFNTEELLHSVYLQPRDGAGGWQHHQ